MLFLKRAAFRRAASADSVSVIVLLSTIFAGELENETRLVELMHVSFHLQHVLSAHK
jgi:hypothetical protein